MKIYLAGSLRNEKMLTYRDVLQEAFPMHDIFMDWYAAGPRADDHWKDYWVEQGVSYQDALGKPNSQNTFLFDKKHIDESDILVLAAPAGKSGHLELGYAIGKGKVGIYFFPEEEDLRWDVMLNFASEVVVGTEQLVASVDNFYSHACEAEGPVPVFNFVR